MKFELAGEVHFNNINGFRSDINVLYCIVWKNQNKPHIYIGKNGSSGGRSSAFKRLATHILGLTSKSNTFSILKEMDRVGAPVKGDFKYRAIRIEVVDDKTHKEIEKKIINHLKKKSFHPELLPLIQELVTNEILDGEYEITNQEQ